LPGSSPIDSSTTGPELRYSPQGFAVKGQNEDVGTLGAEDANRQGTAKFLVRDKHHIILM
jgi:hypothetical protein